MNLPAKKITTTLQFFDFIVYFYPINRTLHILKKKLALSGLILLLLTIHTTKAFHTHRNYNIDKHAISISSHCETCEFNFAKDGESTTFYLVAVHSPSYIQFPVSFTYPHITSIGFVYADRGPPASV
jgi:hypothetical protein